MSEANSNATRQKMALALSSKNMSDNVDFKKITCERYRRRVVKFEQNSKLPRRVLMSKSRNTSSTPNQAKSSSTGKIKNLTKPTTTKARKTTKSDLTVQDSNKNKRPSEDCCKNCGDTYDSQAAVFDRFPSTMVQRVAEADDENDGQGKSAIRYSTSRMKQTVKQYYRNENFQRSSESIQEADKACKKKSSLTTIKEASEQQLVEKNSKSSGGSYYAYTESSDYEGLTSDEDSLEDIKEFRDKNFFECHDYSSTSGTSMEQHKCVYRFYLNDRLFPVPLCTDHQNNIRCVECLLPLQKNPDSTFQNGAIQTKVKIDNEEEPLDMTLFLPVKDSLIIRERRLEKKKPQQEDMYFGVIKLGDRANCKTFLPTNSLALRYQKGYTEYKPIEEYKFEPIAKEDIIII